MKLTEEGIDMFANRRPDRPELWKESSQQLVRRKELRERCSAEELNPLLDLSRMVYDDKHKVVMCVVPKAACTTMKRAMWFLQGNVDKANINQVNTKLLVLGSGKIKTLNLLPKTEALKRLLNYTTFVVMRDPTARIVSAHSSKFTNRTSSPSYKLFYGRQIAMRQAVLYSKGVKLNYRNIVATSNLKMDPDFQRLSTDKQQEVIDYAKIMRFGNISFHQFGRSVSQQNPSHTKSFDVHWRPQVDLCNPCLFNYDYVIKFENLATEANGLLRYLQRNDPEEKKYFVDETHNPLIDDEKTRKVFDGIGNDVLDGLERIYAHDFRVLGYKTSFNSFKNTK
ncbi:unnamed protein product [Clavelina lepadiformis]|uniref:Carbohydrate sulfotransferase n=1 Tax=Clavelina lepadiformis TaxID=159417 RepID=A0ABP0G0T2_CLALP